jgi:hypothetical protein
LDLNGLLNNIVVSVSDIDMGRRGFATDGKEHEGRISFEDGISRASAAFREAYVTADPQTLLLVEEVFLQQELNFCNEADTDTKNSLIQAIQSFEDALRCLKTTENPAGYRFVETAFPTNPKYRIHSYPRDAFHLACAAHCTRLRNILRTPGINMIEKTVLRQRTANMIAAQDSYMERQKTALRDTANADR